jgi:hypothetical protein
VLSNPVTEGYVASKPWSLPALTDNDNGYIVHPNSAAFNGDRYTKNAWAGKGDYEGVPLYSSVTCLARAHNNIVSDAFMLWEDFFRYWEGLGSARVYSGETLPLEPQNMPTSAGAADNSDGNQLLRTGYFKANLAALPGREVRVYIPDTAVLRPYYHFIAIPDGADVDRFIVSSGWKRIADETGECLYLLMPDAETKAWGSLEAELAYMNAANAYHRATPMGSGGTLSIYGNYYVVGYGEGAAPLEAWAAENTHLVISRPLSAQTARMRRSCRPRAPHPSAGTIWPTATWKPWAEATRGRGCWSRSPPG